MNTTAFVSEKRSAFYKTTTLPFYDAFYQAGSKKIYYPYALYTCQKEDQGKISELQKASVAVANVYDKVLEDIKGFSPSDLSALHFAPKYADLLQVAWDRPFCMRVGWGWKDGKPKVIEINAQTPSFWFEPEQGNTLLAKEFGLTPVAPKAQRYLKKALNQAIQQSLMQLPAHAQHKPRIGFVTCNFYEDLHIMNWLSQFCDYEFEILTMEDLDFTKGENIAFNRKTKQKLDALVLWYPLEWLVKLKFQNGDSVWDVLLQATLQRSCAVVHAFPSFLIQSKAMLSYITQHKDTLGDTPALKKGVGYFPHTYFTNEQLGNSYFAKPIWGREGRGSHMIKNGEMIRSRYQEDYYVKQPMVYQELLDLPQITLENKTLTCIYETWVYRVDGKWVAGNVGLRGSEHCITDDYSYWIPIGF